MSDLIQRLKTEAHDFNFFQAVSLLEEKFASEIPKDLLNSGKVRFLPDPSIVFPPNDITSITEKKGIITFLLPFMGLVGVSSPLPIYFSEYISRYPDNADALYNFLAIFNHRLYALFYKSWKKYHFMRSFTASASNTFTRQIASLAGLNSKTIDTDKIRLLAYCAILSSSRSASGLRTIISDIFDGIPVEIVEFFPRWAPLRNINALGENCCLGESSILGDTFYDFSGKFKIIIGPLERESYESFLPGTANVDAVKKLVSAYLAEPLEFDIEVQLQSTELIPVELGKDNSRLGETSSLGRTDGKTNIQWILV